MRIAIIIPVYNVTKFLKEALGSVISQDYPDKEIIVVNDGSLPEVADEIQAICAQYLNIRLLQISHAGAAIARDCGLRACSADSVVFLDADDLLAPGALKFFSDSLSSNSRAIGIYGRVLMIDENGNKRGARLPSEDRINQCESLLESLLERKLPFCNGSICIRREYLDNTLLGRERLSVGEDWVLWCHLATRGPISYGGDTIVLLRRKHTENVSSRALNHPELVLAPCDYIYSDDRFMQKVGKSKMKELLRRGYCRVYAQLAHHYSLIGDFSRAAEWFQKIDLPLSELGDGDLCS